MFLTMHASDAIVSKGRSGNREMDSIANIMFSSSSGANDDPVPSVPASSALIEESETESYKNGHNSDRDSVANRMFGDQGHSGDPHSNSLRGKEVGRKFLRFKQTASTVEAEKTKNSKHNDRRGKTDSKAHMSEGEDIARMISAQKEKDDIKASQALRFQASKTGVTAAGQKYLVNQPLYSGHSVPGVPMPQALHYAQAGGGIVGTNIASTSPVVYAHQAGAAQYPYASGLYANTLPQPLQLTGAPLQSQTLPIQSDLLLGGGGVPLASAGIGAYPIPSSGIVQPMYGVSSSVGMPRINVHGGISLPIYRPPVPQSSTAKEDESTDAKDNGGGVLGFGMQNMAPMPPLMMGFGEAPAPPPPSTITTTSDILPSPAPPILPHNLKRFATTDDVKPHLAGTEELGYRGAVTVAEMDLPGMSQSMSPYGKLATIHGSGATNPQDGASG
eukprot:g33.t1